MSNAATSEWLDIVDENDHVIGRDTREQVHEGGHRHRSAHMVLFNTQGQVFVQRRSMNKDTNAGLWDTSAAGHVDSGETYIDCAVRELHEELGIRVEPAELQKVGVLSPEARNGMEFTHVYSVVCDQSLTLEAAEIDDGCWLLPSDLQLWIEAEEEVFTDVFRTIWAMVNNQ